MGHVTKKTLPGGIRYYAVYKDPGGRRKTEGGFRLKKDATAMLARRISEVASGTLGQDVTLADFYAQWIEAKSHNVKPSTLASIKEAYSLHILPTLGSKRLSSVLPRDVQALTNTLSGKLAPASVGKVYRYLRACLNQAVAWGVLDKSPCRGISLPRVEHGELAFLQPEQIPQLLEVAYEPARTLYATLALSGLRLGEALGLAWNHVDFDRRVLVVERARNQHTRQLEDPKTKASRRSVPMMPLLERELLALREGEGNPAGDTFVFTLTGNPLDPGNMRRALAHDLKEAELPKVTLHSLRHTFASAMLSSGASIKALQRALGHASASMTLNTYSHLLAEDLTSSLERADSLFVKK